MAPLLDGAPKFGCQMAATPDRLSFTGTIDSRVRWKTMIRKATHSDVPQIATIHVETWRHAYSGIVSRAFLDSLCVKTHQQNWERQIDDPANRILVSQRGDTVTGFLAGGDCRDDDLPGWPEIYAIYVHPDSQKHGFGKRLAEAFLREHNRHCSLWVLADNRPAITFYRNLGFRHDDRSKTITIDGKELEEHRYLRSP